MDEMELIKARMDELGVSASELSKLTGITRSSLSLYFSGKNKPRPAYLKMMRDALSMKSTARRNVIPVYGSISAGIPIEAIQDIIDYEEVSTDIYKDVRDYFALKLKGVSMLPRMHSGDVVIFHKQSTADTGDIVAVMVGGDDATCKQLIKTDTGISLHSFNDAFGDFTFTWSQISSLPITILGKAVELRAKL